MFFLQHILNTGMKIDNAKLNNPFTLVDTLICYEEKQDPDIPTAVQNLINARTKLIIW